MATTFGPVSNTSLKSNIFTMRREIANARDDAHANSEIEMTFGFIETQNGISTLSN